MNIREVAQDYLASITTRLNPRTRAGYSRRLNVFVAWCESNQVQLEQVNNELVHRFLKYLYETQKPYGAARTHLSIHTLQGYLRVIRSFLMWCLEGDRYTDFVSYRTVMKIRFDQSVL